MITKSFDQFTVYQDSISSAFVYANFDDEKAFMNGFSDYILNEDNLLNYANTLTPIEFVPNKIHYKKLYITLSSFFNKDLELLTYCIYRPHWAVYTRITRVIVSTQI